MFKNLLKSKKRTSENAYNEFLSDGILLTYVIKLSPHRPFDEHMHPHPFNDQLTPR